MCRVLGGGDFDAFPPQTDEENASLTCTSPGPGEGVPQRAATCAVLCYAGRDDGPSAGHPPPSEAKGEGWVRPVVFASS